MLNQQSLHKETGPPSELLTCACTDGLSLERQAGRHHRERSPTRGAAADVAPRFPARGGVRPIDACGDDRAPRAGGDHFADRQRSARLEGGDLLGDIYSTGVVLYEIFTGSLPFEGDSPLAVVLKHVNDAPPVPKSRNPRIDPKIAAIIMKCMEKDAGARFQTVGELYEALARMTTQQAA